MEKFQEHVELVEVEKNAMASNVYIFPFLCEKGLATFEYKANLQIFNTKFGFFLTLPEAFYSFLIIQKKLQSLFLPSQPLTDFCSL